MSQTNPTHPYLSENIQRLIEDRYLVRINQQAQMDQVVRDPQFIRQSHNYPPFFSDHGVIHHRDVARQVLTVLGTVHGLLIPERSLDRVEFMRAYGVITAFLHDLGMADFSDFGRAIHPEFATQAIFAPDFDDILAALWSDEHNPLISRLIKLC